MMTLKEFSVKLLALITLGGSLSLASCQPEETDPADDRDKFVDVWRVTETSSVAGAMPAYDVHINLSTTSNTQVLVENFYNIGFSYKAIGTISGTNITFNNQTYNSNQLNGSGSMSGNNTINLTYYMNDGTTIDTCDAQLVRQ